MSGTAEKIDGPPADAKQAKLYCWAVRRKVGRCSMEASKSSLHPFTLLFNFVLALTAGGMLFLTLYFPNVKCNFQINFWLLLTACIILSAQFVTIFVAMLGYPLLNVYNLFDHCSKKKAETTKHIDPAALKSEEERDYLVEQLVASKKTRAIAATGEVLTALQTVLQTAAIGLLAYGTWAVINTKVGSKPGTALCDNRIFEPTFYVTLIISGIVGLLLLLFAVGFIVAAIKSCVDVAKDEEETVSLLGDGKSHAS